MKNLEEKILMARGLRKSDLVFKNAKVVDVFSNKIINGDIAVSGGIILGVGDYSGADEIDLEGKFVSPCLIDGHVHIESSMVTPTELAKVLIPNGVATIIADPHEIANVLGIDGINYLLEASENLPLDVRIMLPSCVPATDFEHSGANLVFKDLEKLKDRDRVLGLGEMMNYPGVINCDKVVMDKIEGFSDRVIDGHAPGLLGKALNAYALSGIKTDHECSTVEEMNERISNGMYVQIRQGTSAKNAEILTKGITKDNLSRILFCTDDKHPKDLLEKGSVNENIKIAIKNGIDPIDAIKIATINAAKCYDLKGKGAIAPGYEANFIVLDDIVKFVIDSVYIDGKKISEGKKLLREIKSKTDIKSIGEVKVHDRRLEDFEIKLNSNRANVIGINPNELLTEKLVEEVPVHDGVFKADDVYQKLIVIERHNGLDSFGKGIIKGFGIKNGSIASTIAHDSHNIIIIGDNDKDIYRAMEEIKNINGGITVVSNGEVLASLPLEIAGLMSSGTVEETSLKLEKVLDAIKNNLGVNCKSLDPILTLGFMSLPVIPNLKLTDEGLFDVSEFKFIDINA
ncbi:adenine deaminase [Peptoniphilus sp.]|jgi:adenine deaminase|uniref:adenine deaminase n=1 Tax=Peptoniphilus sp. TaxID=1971214 RepID=UPI003D8ADB94